jgi:hypothetical protein
MPISGKPEIGVAIRNPETRRQSIVLDSGFTPMACPGMTAMTFSTLL